MINNESVNLIDESGILAISTRLQRLSDQIRKDGLLVYKAFGIEFEPKWFPVIYTLQFKSPLSVLELAAEIGFAHPSTISLLKELEQQKLISSLRDQADERKRLVMLTGKAWELIEQMKPVWDLMINVLTEVTETENNLMKALNEVEEQLRNKSFFTRAIGLVEQMKSRREVEKTSIDGIEVKIVESAEGKKIFGAIQKSVLKEGVEEQLMTIGEDSKAVNYLATVNDLPAGTCSYRKTKTGYQLEGLAVLEQYRGLGVGKAMISMLLEQQLDKIYLNSPIILVTWFEKLGFSKKGKPFFSEDNTYYKMVL
ncbi:bifunctional helix-turn-helix transcriptional regulator/GNAT family N-acetyltransferase [Pedobacter cryoconitis]|uniref:DNA-binding MarR family transcriptional regulator/GNAT superfamily N-acetyltransferase n=1 Tax=Pedobacter cryoconitis TaxID=188932 RepID=A0A7X0MHD5_9SPHI|nr:bifunctional helix-turn-helix transcriptional regulator/GNAT family N-acetyltransferase [Pedobacter cryoconitis]MBB6499262.1 DNA-binding MarR family transcriptional regulator/GNAT superfamily N-acetyltransferase [Pedobacter cryoconitis]